MAYRIALPPNLVGMHDVFHVSMLKKYIANPDVIMEYELVKIVDKKEQMLRTKTIPIIKLLCRNHGVEEASREAE